MLKHRQAEHSGAEGSEEQIRADERARVERELRDLDDDQRHSGRPVAVGPTGDGHERDERAATVHDDRVVVAEERPDLDEPLEVVRKRSFSIGQLLAMIVGAALIALGIAALTQTGVETPLSEPVEPVLGWDHTPMLGIIEIAAGALLIVFALRPGGRWLVAMVGAALIVGGGLILAEIDWTVDELGAEQGFGWVPIVAGAAAVLAAILTPRRYQRMTGTPVSGQRRLHPEPATAGEHRGS